MIDAMEPKKAALGGNGTRPVDAAPPSARGPKWSAEEVDCIVLAFDACKGNPARFHAEFNDITTGRQRTLAELRLHLPRVAAARGLEVAPKFLDDCDAVIDGAVAAMLPVAVAPVAAPVPFASISLADVVDDGAVTGADPSAPWYPYKEEQARPVAMRGLTIMQLCSGYEWGRWYLDLDSGDPDSGDSMPTVCYRHGEKSNGSDYWIPFRRIDEMDWVEHVGRKGWSEFAGDNLELALSEVREWRDRINEWATPRRKFKGNPVKLPTGAKSLFVDEGGGLYAVVQKGRDQQLEPLAIPPVKPRGR